METVSGHFMFTGEIEVMDRFRDGVDELKVCGLLQMVSNAHAMCQ